MTVFDFNIIRGLADINHFFEAELQPQTEQQKNYADVGPESQIFLIADGRNKVEKRSGKNTGQNISQNNRLFELFK